MCGQIKGTTHSVNRDLKRRYGVQNLKHIQWEDE